MKCKYKKFLKAAYIDYGEDYCGHGSGTFTKPAVTTPIIVFIGATVTIACAISGATIYYTLDGSTPTSSSTQYTGAITLTQSCTIKAIAVKPGMSDSQVASENYIHYLTTWRLVGNSSIHTDPYLTSWKITGRSSQQEYLTQWKVEGNSYVYTETYPDDVVLPNGYKRCKYLEFHGTEYINSGIVNRSDIGFSLDLSTTSDGKTIIGARSSINDGVVFGCNYVDENTNYTPIAYGSYTIGYANKIIADGSRHNIVLDWQQAKIDSYSFGITRGDTFPQLSIYIGTWNNNNVPDSKMFVGKIYSVVLYCNDGNLFYGIPCLDNNNVPCLYDAVSGTSFYNAGTGTFGYEEWPLIVEIRSCGDYSAVDGKYHVKIDSWWDVCDIALDEPLRKVGNVADTIEFPSGTDGKALLTRYIKSILIGNTTPSYATTNTSGKVRWKIANDAKNVASSNMLGNVLSSKYSAITSSSQYNNVEGVCVNTGNNLIIVYDELYSANTDANAFKAANADVEVIYELATPTTELIDVPQIHSSDDYWSATTTPYSAFTYATPQIYSCGDYSDVDGKYHVKISNGVTIYDIPLTEPLRKVNDVADTIEFPSNTEGKALVTRYFDSTDMGKMSYRTVQIGTTGYYRIVSYNLINVIKKQPSYYSTSNVLTPIYAAISAGAVANRTTGLGLNANGDILIYDPDYDQADSATAFKAHVDGVELIYELATPTTELVDVSPFPVSPTNTYTSANIVPYSAFEHTENNEIWSCGEYNATDGKWHILVQPQGGSIADIALTEPLRMINEVADTIEFPSETEGKALVTRNVESKIVSAYTNKDGSQLTTTLPDNTILHIKQFVKNGDFSDGSTEWRYGTSKISCDYSQNKAVISNNVVGHGYLFAIIQDIRSNIVIGNSYYFKYNAIPCKDIVLGADYSNRSNTRVSCVGNTNNIVSDVVKPASLNQFYLGFSPTTDYEVGDTTEVDNVVSFNLDVMFADCPSFKPTTASGFEAMFTNLSYIDYSSDAQEVIVNDGKLYKEDVTGIEILVPLATPTTELVDAPQIQEADSYTCVITPGAKAVEWSNFTTE